MAEHTVQIRYHATTNDIMSAQIRAIGGVPHITDNEDGTYDLWSDDECLAIGIGYDDDGMADAYSNVNFNVTKIEVLSGHTLSRLFSFSIEGETYGVFFGFSDVDEIVWTGRKSITDLSFAFFSCTSLTRLIPINFFNGLKPVEVSNMFKGCTNLGSVDFSGCDFSEVLYFSSMFDGCSSLGYVAPMNFMSGAAPYGINGMFKTASSLKHMSFEGVDFSQCSDMSELFYYCHALECITNIDTRNVVYGRDIFYECDSLVQPDSAAVSDITDSDGAVWVNPDACSGIRAFRQKESLPHIRHFEQKESLMSVLTDFTQKETFPAIYTFSQSETYPAIYRFMQKESLMLVLTDFMQRESLMSRARVFRQLESYEEEKIYAVSYFRQRESLEAVENREKLIKVVPV